MKPPEPETLSPSKIAEVKAFMKAKEALEELRALFPVAFKKLTELADTYNATLDAADAAVRARGVSSGPFELYSHVRKDNASILYAAVGRQKFPTLGGVVTTSEVLSIDRKLFDSLIAQQKVDPELADTVIAWEPRYHKPGKIVVP